MNYIISGIGISQHTIFEELKRTKLNVKQVEYSQFTAQNDDLALIIYDGIQINQCTEFLSKHSIDVIPIFVDIDRIMIPGYFKRQEEENIVCWECALARMKEYFFHSKMYEVLISNDNVFPKIYFLPEEIAIFCEQLKAFIENPSFHHSIANFSFDYLSMVFREISGYTNCPNCDRHDSGLEELIHFMEGRRKYVTSFN